jgi:hypothetical protein
MRNTILVSIAILILMAPLACQETPTTVADVGAALDSLDLRLEWLDYRLNLERWDFAHNGEADSLEFYEDLLRAVLVGKYAMALARPGQQTLDDPDEQKRYRRIRSRVVWAQIELDPVVTALRDSLSQVRDGFSATFEGSDHNREYLEGVVARDRDRTSRELAQNALDAAGEDLADGVQRLIRRRNQLAQRKGYNNYVGLVFDCRNIDGREYVSLLNRIDTATAEKYNEVLSSIKRQLALNMAEKWDLQFAANDVNRRVDRFFPTDSQLAFVRQSLFAIGYDINMMPLYFDLREFPDEPVSVGSYNVAHGYDHRVSGNLAPGLSSTRSLMLHTGRMLYAASISQPNESDAKYPDPVWEMAMAGILAALCDDPQWLETHAHLPAELAQEYSSSQINQRVIGLRRLLVDLMFEYEAYQNANRDLNELYWNLQDDFVGLPRHEQTRPWGVLSGLIDQPLTMSDELMADMIVAQSLAFIDRNYKSLIDPQMTRAFLEQNYFRFGGRRDWTELLDRGTDEPLNFEHLMTSLGI